MSEITVNKSPSTILYDFLKETVEAAAAGTILNGADVLDSAWQEIKADKGIVISNSEWDFAPSYGTQTEIYDALLIVAFFYEVPSGDTSERAEARDKCFQMAQAFADKLFEGNQDLGGRVCKGFLLLRATDGDKSVNSATYAIINQPIILNPSGSRIDYTLGEAK